MRTRTLLLVAVVGAAAAGAMGFIPWFGGGASTQDSPASDVDADLAAASARENVARASIARPLAEQSADIQERYRSARAEHAGHGMKTLSVAAANGSDERTEEEVKVLMDLTKEIQP